MGTKTLLECWSLTIRKLAGEVCDDDAGVDAFRLRALYSGEHDSLSVGGGQDSLLNELVDQRDQDCAARNGENVGFR